VRSRVRRPEDGRTLLEHSVRRKFREPDQPTEVYSDDPGIEVIVFDLGSSYDITDPEDIDEESMVDDLRAIDRHLEDYPDGEINRGLLDVREQLVEALRKIGVEVA
jgi:hypothetical protein